MASESTPSCFVPVKALPLFEDRPIGGLELCRVMESVCGEGKVEGAMKISGLWRLQVKDRTARNALLLHGLAVRGVTVTVLSKNPFLVDGQDTTKLIIGNIPFSVSDSEIVKSLKQIDVVLASNVKWEHYRDEAGRLTSFKTGRRFVYIATPRTPLPQLVKVAGMFSAFLFYRERQTEQREGINPQREQEPSANKETVCQDNSETARQTQESGGERLTQRQGKLKQSLLTFDKERGRQLTGKNVGRRARSWSQRRCSPDHRPEEKRQCQGIEGGEGEEETLVEESQVDWFALNDSDSRGQDD